MRIAIVCATSALISMSAIRAAEPALAPAPSPKSRPTDGVAAQLSGVLIKHFDQLLDADGEVRLKGKSADGTTALALYLTAEAGRDKRFRAAAVKLAERIVADMRATKHGVLYIKEKDKGDGETIAGGGPPALGLYAGFAAYVFHKEGGHDDDLLYIAGVLDRFPWNERGWWASTMDVDTGIPKESIDKPSIINKTAAMAMAAGMTGAYVRKLDPELSARLIGKAKRCIYEQIIPAQEPDGFWHYSLADNDPKNKDILGYFMVTCGALINLQLLTDDYRDAKFQAALDKACGFAAKHMAPMTDPNNGPPAPQERRTPETPDHYDRQDDAKRGLALAMILLAGGHDAEAVKITNHWLETFPYGNQGQDGAHAAHECAVMLHLVRKRLE